MIHPETTTRFRDPVQLSRPSSQRKEATEIGEHLCGVLGRAFSVAVSILEDTQKAKGVVEEAVLEMIDSEPESLDHPDFRLKLMRNVAQRGINLLVEQYEVTGRPEEQNRSAGAVEVDLHHCSQQRASNVKDAVDHLPPLHRAVLRLHYVAGFSFDDIAHLTSVPELNARTLMAEAYKMLMSSRTTDSVRLSSARLPNVG